MAFSISPRSRLVSAARVLAAIGFLATLVVHLATYSEHGPDLTAITMTLFAGIFPVWFVAVIAMLALTPQGSRFSWQNIIRPLGPKWGAALAVLVAYVALNFALGMTGLPGSPTQDGNKYYLENHGIQTPISQSAYVKAHALQSRLFSGHALLFYGVGFVVLTAVRRQRSQR